MDYICSHVTGPQVGTPDCSNYVVYLLPALPCLGRMRSLVRGYVFVLVSHRLFSGVGLSASGGMGCPFSGFYGFSQVVSLCEPLR